ncbi:MAG: hypothetical protein IT167_27930 [Bryobacterales bacterium]|nr:hypothetical protein [Bryobacterales bacterium]
MTKFLLLPAAAAAAQTPEPAAGKEAKSSLGGQAEDFTYFHSRSRDSFDGLAEGTPPKASPPGITRRSSTWTRTRRCWG